MIRPALLSALALAAASAWARYEEDVYGEPSSDSGLPGPELGWEMVLAIVAYFGIGFIGDLLSNSDSPIVSTVGKCLYSIMWVAPLIIIVAALFGF